MANTYAWVHRELHAAATEAAVDKDVWVVGGGLAGQFADAGLLDKVWVHQTPLVLGAGATFLRRLRLRRERRLGLAALAEVEGPGDDVLGYVATAPDGARTLVVANLSTEQIGLPEGASVLVASGELVDGRVPADTAVWAELP